MALPHQLPIETASARGRLEAALAELQGGWLALPELAIGGPPGGMRLDYVLLHPRCGIVLLEAAPGCGRDAVAVFSRCLDRQHFHEVFPGELPVVHLVYPAEADCSLAQGVAAAFAGVPELTVADADWAEALSELLLSLSAAEGAADGSLRREAPRSAGDASPSPADQTAPAAAAPTAVDAQRSADAAEAMILPDARSEAAQARRRARRAWVAGNAIVIAALGAAAGGWMAIHWNFQPAPLPAVVAVIPAVEPPPAPSKTTLSAAPSTIAPQVVVPPPRLATAAPPKPLLPPADLVHPENDRASLPVGHGDAGAKPDDAAAKTAAISAPTAPAPSRPVPAVPPAMVASVPPAALPRAEAAPPPAPIPKAEASLASPAPVPKRKERRLAAAPAPEERRAKPRRQAEAKPVDLPRREARPPDNARPGPAMAPQRPPPAPLVAAAPRMTQEAALPVPTAAPTPLSSGRVCRSYTSAHSVLGTPRRITGIACQAPDGSWEIVSETPEN